MYRCVGNVILDADSKLFFILQFKDKPTLPADHPRGKASSKLNNIGMKFERGDLSVENMVSQCYSVWTPLQPVFYSLRFPSTTRAFRVNG